ncbi:hypothetical protein HYH02_006417 [Chlamydomonas schloesseri]|uniref:Uncharacterized protein n=1 Tax=Chlamydomonas schloesseri TaxID=2026947 RepID=A0A835WJE9_9CHLO|nr:hypothetical protein HYH02_006417 [Chlamydomonas schloesseri]|eukprot:KAG2448526.1 hypothetical protein HYH02_006417 [Chlamydomonas schloesseri]
MYKEDAVPLDPSHPELINLKNQAEFKKLVSGVAFAAQLGLTLLSAAALYFSFAAHPATAGPTWHRLFTAVGITVGFLTMWFSHVFIGSATKMQNGEPVSPSWISGNLLRCMVFNIAAIVVLAVGLQASVGSLGLQSLATSAAGPSSAAATAVAVVGVDVLSLQAITTCLLSHAVSLAHLNAIFRMVRAARYPRGGVVMGSMDGMALKSVEGP